MHSNLYIDRYGNAICSVKSTFQTKVKEHNITVAVCTMTSKQN